MSHHDLLDFLQEVSVEIDAEYKRIQKSAKYDPGTAGDEGEENWAGILRDWLPPAYHVVTKGQIMSLDGSLSPQIDVLVLHPTYPKRLRNKKKYLAEGVLAAFECKLTLTKKDIYDTVKNSALIKRLVHSEKGTPYKELTSPIIYGLLAHSYVWKSEKGAVLGTISSHLSDADKVNVEHPREMLDLFCVSDLATWVASKQPALSPDDVDDWSEEIYGTRGLPATSYMCHTQFGEFFRQDKEYTPIGVFLTALLIKLAWEDTSLRRIASYFEELGFLWTSSGSSRTWSMDVYSDELRDKVSYKRLSDDWIWDEWNCSIE
jgi:hypothetical protein